MNTREKANRKAIATILVQELSERQLNELPISQEKEAWIRETAEFLRRRQQPFATYFAETVGMEWPVPPRR